MEQISPALAKLFHVQHEIKFVETAIEHEQENIAYVNVLEMCMPNHFAADKAYLEQVRRDATAKIKRLTDDLKILNLKLKDAHDALADDAGSEVPFE